MLIHVTSCIRSEKMFGIANLQRRLYVLDYAYHHFTHSSVVNNSYNLWHLRLGHISNIGLQTVSKVFPFIPCKNNIFPCDLCQFAKQRKLPFPTSLTYSSTSFDILHVDLWGIFSTISTLGHQFFLTLVDDYKRYT